MDPHLRAVREWNKTYLPTEKEAYHEARINGYIFPQLGPDGHIGSLYEEELEAIASHPPSINLTRYKQYKRMSKQQLEREFPALVDVIGPKITEEDLFYYATRGWIPEYDTLNFKIDRWGQYNDLSEVGKSLMDLLYTNHKGYVDKSGHPLEPYIIAYDQNIDDDSAIRAIGERIGISIPPDVPAHDSFYEKLVDHIETNEPYGYQRVRRQNSSTTKQVIDMTEKQYHDRIAEKGYKSNSDNNEPNGDNYYPNYLYSDRLRSIRQL